jgi:hypothetical protein
MMVLALTMLAAPPATHGQPAGKVWRLGVLSGGSAGAAPLEAFRQGLRELGWVEGQNLIVMLGAFTPVELGLVKSLARPGGNVTGSSWSVDAALMGKGL